MSHLSFVIKIQQAVFDSKLTHTVSRQGFLSLSMVVGDDAPQVSVTKAKNSSPYTDMYGWIGYKFQTQFFLRRNLGVLNPVRDEFYVSRPHHCTSSSGQEEPLDAKGPSQGR
jgi:hypothetical protein